jgi:hypothetical protein
MYTEQEIQIAKSLIEEDTMAFLVKVFTESKSTEESKLLSNVLLDDAQYGQLAKVIRINHIRNDKTLKHIIQVANSKREKRDIAQAPK